MKMINKTIKVLATVCAALIIGVHTGMDALMVALLGTCLSLINVDSKDA